MNKAIRCCFNCQFYKEDNDFIGKYFKCKLFPSSRYRQDLAFGDMICEDFEPISLTHPIYRCGRCGSRATYIQIQHGKKTGELRCIDCVEWSLNTGYTAIFINDLSQEKIEKLLPKEKSLKKISLHKTEKKAYNFINGHGGCVLVDSLPRKFIGALGNLRQKKVIEIGTVIKYYMDTESRSRAQRTFKVCALRYDEVQVR